MPVRVIHEPDNPVDAQALAFQCQLDGVWHCSVLARTGSTGKLPVGAVRCWLKVGKQPILPALVDILCTNSQGPLLCVGKRDLAFRLHPLSLTCVLSIRCYLTAVLVHRSLHDLSWASEADLYGVLPVYCIRAMASNPPSTKPKRPDGSYHKLS